MVAGKLTVGNHSGCAVVIPENRVEPGQTFAARTFAHLKVRGERGHIRLVDPAHATLLEDDEDVPLTRNLEQACLRVPRLDSDGDTDFVVELALDTDDSLPDPRSQMLRISRSSAMIAALFTAGLPLGSTREVHLGPISASVSWDGAALHLSQYLSSYRRPDGSFIPFFYRKAGQRFRTMPEDGRSVTLHPGETLLCGASVIVLEVNDTPS